MAEGPGRLRGQSPDRPEQQLEAAWTDKLRVDPQGKNQVISLSGGAELTFPGLGRIRAKEIFLWLMEMPPPTATDKNELSRLRPTSMQALGDVQMDSPDLSGRVEELQVWFKEVASGRETAVTARPGTVVPGIGPVRAAAAVGVTPMGATVEQSPPALALPRQTPGQVLQRFEVVGRLLRAQVVFGGQQAAVSNLTIVDGVRLEGRGLKLVGSNVNLDCSTNHLWIDGAGQMELPISGVLQGKAPAAAGVLTVDWQRRMEFDGLTARFESVVATTTQHHKLSTETMKVVLERPIDFSQADAQEQPRVQEIQCSGGVAMEGRTFDEQQGPSAYVRMQLTDLVVNMISGALNGGPGWVNSVRYGSANPLDRPIAAVGNTPANAASPQSQLNCLHVQFQRSVTGNLGDLSNLMRGRLTFSDRVWTTYAPVDNWDAMLTTHNPDELGPDGIVARCDQLTVAQTLTPIGSRPSIKLDALGNTVVEGTKFTARGNRITYDEAKDLLILQGGDGRNPAELLRQLQPGAAADKQAFQEIHYWPKTGRMKVIGVQPGQINLLPGGNGKRQ
jgi:hypothetical protein